MAKTEYETARQLVDLRMPVIRIRIEGMDLAWRLPIEQMLREEGYQLTGEEDGIRIYKRSIK